MIGAVADGMNGHTDSTFCSQLPVLQDLFGIQKEQPGIGGFVFVRLQHGGGLRTKGAVSEQLNRPDA